MAEYRFRPNPNFEIVVTAAAMGVDRNGNPISGGAESRVTARGRRRTTLLNVGEKIIAGAKSDANRELPSRTNNGGRDVSYPWAAPDRSGRTYNQSFELEIVRRNGRFQLIVRNTHQFAYEVEYGNAGGARRRVTRHDGRFYALPLSGSGVKRFRRYENTPEAKERARARAQKSYYTRRAKVLQSRKGPLAKAEGELAVRKFRQGQKSVALIDQRSIAARRKHYEASKARLNKNYAAAVTKLGPARPRAFVGISNKTNKPTLFTQTFHTYKGYAILRHATRRVTVRTLE